MPKAVIMRNMCIHSVVSCLLVNKFPSCQDRPWLFVQWDLPKLSHLPVSGRRRARGCLRVVTTPLRPTPMVSAQQNISMAEDRLFVVGTSWFLFFFLGRSFHPMFPALRVARSSDVGFRSCQRFGFGRSSERLDRDAAQPSSIFLEPQAFVSQAG
jgi:hypothetical protein